MHPGGHRIHVGGDWSPISLWQHNWIKKNISSYHNAKMLDLGCGSLRLGHLLIPEMQPENYIGFDINRNLINKGIEHEIDNSIIEKKKPKFITNNDMNFEEIEDNSLDYVWCYAVFIHVNDDTVSKALQNLRHKLKPNAPIYSTFHFNETRPSRVAKKFGSKPKEDYVYDDKQQAWGRTPAEIKKLFKDNDYDLSPWQDVTPKTQYLYKSISTL
jgi:ubiquinone/menaquinone biosynthesis C-methylase UbiE